MSIREYASYTFESESGVETVEWANALVEQFGPASEAEPVHDSGDEARGEPSTCPYTSCRSAALCARC